MVLTGNLSCDPASKRTPNLVEGLAAPACSPGWGKEDMQNLRDSTEVI